MIMQRKYFFFFFVVKKKKRKDFEESKQRKDLKDEEEKKWTNLRVSMQSANYVHNICTHTNTDTYVHLLSKPSRQADRITRDCGWKKGK